MNQDRAKEILLSVEDAPLDFTVVFSGKRSKKVNGLYKPDSREILIHNRNFDDDNLLLYTALHEYAHHLHCCARGGKLSVRSHTAEFWAILHGLLQKAEDKGAYRNVFADAPELDALTETIRKKCLYEDGALVKELGKLLMEASGVCKKIGARFEDYVDRVLRIPRLAAKTAMKIYQYNVNPSMGADNMKIVAGIANADTREQAAGALLAGRSPDEVKARIVHPEPPVDDHARLAKEKVRLERTIAALSKRLEEVEAALGD
jgi:hypothetical protein